MSMQTITGQYESNREFLIILCPLIHIEKAIVTVAVDEKNSLVPLEWTTELFMKQMNISRWTFLKEPGLEYVNIHQSCSIGRAN